MFCKERLQPEYANVKRFHLHTLPIISISDWTDKQSDYLPHVIKGTWRHGDKFLDFLYKSVLHRFIRHPLKPFRFLLRIRRDIHNQKLTPRCQLYRE